MDSKQKKKYRQSKQWKEIRKKVLDRDNHQCQICGIIKKKGLQVHHINEDAYGHEKLDDLVTLCPSCHKLVERLLRRTRNKIIIDTFNKQLKKIYLESKDAE